MGLKPETADMAWVCVTKEGLTQWVMTLNTPKNEPNIDIPAWSLYRLMEMLEIYLDYSPFTGFNDIGNVSLYDDLIDLVENMISKDIFNKEYLYEGSYRNS